MSLYLSPPLRLRFDIVRRRSGRAKVARALGVASVQIGQIRLDDGVVLLCTVLFVRVGVYIVWREAFRRRRRGVEAGAAIRVLSRFGCWETLFRRDMVYFAGYEEVGSCDAADYVREADTVEEGFQGWCSLFGAGFVV